MSDQAAAKRAAANAAAALVKDGMRLGLGSGSTFLLFLEALGQRIAKEGLKVVGVPTSTATAEAARKHGIGLTTPDEAEVLDLAIDGADQVDPRKNMIKGGGGALVREKIVAAAAKEMVVLVDEGKLVDVLGVAFKLPVEVMTFGWKQARRCIEATGCESALRATAKDEPFVSDNGNYILDCDYGSIDDPAFLHDALNSIPGVVDNGLFIGVAGRIVVGTPDGSTRIIE